MHASQKLDARLAACTTEQLLEIAIRLNLASTAEEVIVSNRVDRLLADRLSEEDFAAHIEMMESMLGAPVAPARPPVTYTVRATESAGPGREFLNRAAANDWARYRQATTGAAHEVCEVYAD